MDPFARIRAIQAKPERLGVGLMSGMSADGLDLALVRIRNEGEGRAVDILSARTASYEKPLSDRVRAATQEPPREVCLLSFELAAQWADTTLAFLRDADVEPAAVDFIASHGQTLGHVPGGRQGRGGTIQVGDGDVLAERTGILTVSDFRPRDIAAGGEGAPLVPLADWLLYAREGEVSACQNLGSIANVTVVTSRREDVVAFDTGPANALIDAFARECGGDHGGIDRDGMLSTRGVVDDAVLSALHAQSADFLNRVPPRSAGYMEFGPALAHVVARDVRARKAEDYVRTAVEFTARTLADAYERFVLPQFPDLRVVRFSGGGVHNPMLMGCIHDRLGALGLEPRELEAPWPDAKEAVAFALLGDETLHGRPGNVPSATGATHEVVLGKISL
ncbi:MAG: anhydro-N-acetylmuramic acid kinase [Planctomycetota bacterium]|jgi:anhydro-N-acetylmuramic acid kinase